MKKKYKCAWNKCISLIFHKLCSVVTVQAMRPTIWSMKKSLLKSISYHRVVKCFLLKLSYALYAMELISALIIRDIILLGTHAHFLIVNRARLFFAILFSIEAICSMLHYVRLFKDSARASSRKWMLKLFSEISICAYWVHVCLIKGISSTFIARS